MMILAEMPPSATEQLLGQGVLGVCVLVLAGVIVFLWKQSASLHAQIDKLNELRLADRDLRLADQRETAKVILEVSDRYKETILSSKAEIQELREEIQSLQARRGGYR